MSAVRDQALTRQPAQVLAAGFGHQNDIGSATPFRCALVQHFAGPHREDPRLPLVTDVEVVFGGRKAGETVLAKLVVSLGQQAPGDRVVVFLGQGFAQFVDALCDPALQTAATRCVLQAAAVLPPDELPEIGVITMARHGAATLEAELALPERAGDDWSITDFESGTCCNDCATLAGFLTDTARQQLTWPLAKPRRQHIHQRIEEAELPVTHRTVRQGSPHKLVLTKTADLHTRAADLRQATRASLQSLQQLLAEVVT